jgi:hypothetical protein
MTRGDVLFYGIVAIAITFFAVVGLWLLREIRRLITTTPRGQRDWTGVAIVFAMMIFGLVAGVGHGFKDLPIGRAFRDLFGTH